MRKLTMTICCMMALASCTAPDDLPQPCTATPAGVPTAVDIMLTRSGGTGPLGERTYRAILLYPTSTSTHQDYVMYHGTYYYNAATGSKTGFLIPWSCDDRGNRLGTGENLNAGLFAHDRSYSLVIASHAVMPVKRTVAVNDSVDRSYWGFYTQRTPLKYADALPGRLQGDEPLYVSKPLPITVSGHGEMRGSNTYRDTVHVDDKADHMLRECRSRLRFIFQCGEDLEYANIQRVVLKNVPASGYWNPMTQQYEEVTLDSVTFYDGESVKLPYSADVATRARHTVPLPEDADATDDAGSFMHLLSQDYTLKDDEGRYIHTLPRLKMVFAHEAEYTIPIIYNFEPHCHYTYTISINSVWLYVTLTVTPWDKGDVEGEVNNGQYVIGRLNLVHGAWEDGGGEDDIDAGTDNAHTTIKPGGAWEDGGGEDDIDTGTDNTHTTIKPGGAWENGGGEDGAIDGNDTNNNT